MEKKLQKYRKIQSLEIGKRKNRTRLTEEKVEWNDYACHIKQVAQCNEWNDHERGLQLPMSLRGVAQRVLGEFYVSTRHKVHINAKILPTRTGYRCEFRNIRRNREESVVEYINALKRLASRAFPFIPIEMKGREFVR